MKIYKYIVIVLLSSFLTIIFYNFGYAVGETNCLGTSQDDVTTFLQNCANNPQNAISPGSGGSIDIANLVTKVSQRVIEFGALFAIGAIVFSGIQYTTSFGDDEKTKKAKMTGLYAAIGLLLLLVSFPLVNIIVTFIYGLNKV